MKRKNLALTVVIVLVSVALAVVGWMVLPDRLVLQLTITGDAGTTLPKLAGLAIPFLISVVFAVLHYIQGSKKHLLVSGVGLLVYGFLFLFN